MKRLLVIGLLLLIYGFAQGQNLNLGVTFQYLVLKQVSVDALTIYPTGSYNYYKVVDNRWKFFSGGQSIVIGLVAQLEYKRAYVTFEPSFELNTYQYTVTYPLTNQADDRVGFRVTNMQYDFPLYVGYQFSASNVMRYSVFAGVELVTPFVIQVGFEETSSSTNPYEQYGLYDMKNVLYNDGSPYFNGLAGIGIHFASVFRVEIRYKYRLDSPGDIYKATFHTVGFGLTYYLPLRLLKQKVYYED